ncbi:alpha-hydroxy acid oxidase [Francisella adeliensis]|uniref:Alpha-hydroxy-acid oxidizing enzyme n=1 Tax=Francisella adeliensis TaxID=2007306 RepID=A0A2Z4XWT3_9GAMM|nr:alpha-hydroxy acid oxidase [Francisella adeliensis]AXA32952.1 alpha-hydroxy-acid oxidizing enzyme [Francisella adeliensis]MBK2086166.1 alpha-hydroxy-acid oxidizing protein [Francisella adeliensis]MBK2096670.1 alpha-hydroxy-acid oxidizing protein [Francisella adeliensis]QIW11179.1 alpha-hydroxy-acid oxidizing protein [Francisella adeliensis]QIW13055.1 alpha-hydroxy-acid oxidizing protein [Francisella adeliensis]
MQNNLQKITSLGDMRKAYHRKVPKMFVDYCESGSWKQQTLKYNQQDFDKYLFKQKVLTDIQHRSLSTKILGQEYKMPLAFAPIGLLGMQHADGEIHAARAAEKFGIPFTLSTMSICSTEEVAKHTTKPFWFQLYMMKDRKFMANLIASAKHAGCSALVLTADLQMLGNRHADIKNGLTVPPKPTIKNLINLSTKTPWCLNMLKTKNRTFGNIANHAENKGGFASLGKWTSEQFDLSLNWHDVEWVQKQWNGPMIIKGIMCTEDAIMAQNTGADAIVVSNHGGRQLDGAPSSISALEEIISTVDTKLEVLIDSGIRTGQDLLKAKALGATAGLIGRPMIYGLGAYGERGAQRVLEIFYEEMDKTMAFCGHTDVNEVDRSILIYAN